MKDYIMEIPGAATPEFCDGMIEKFEADLRKRPGMIGPQGTVDKKIRDSVNLEMNLYHDWKPVVDNVRGMIYSRLVEYLDTIHIGKTNSMWKDGYDSSYTMMKYTPDSVGYNWHNDFMFDDKTGRGGVRTVTWLFYINDCEGGETEFGDGTKIKCEQGKLVLFPSTWTMTHRGHPPIGGDKYLGVGWLCSTWNKTTK